jgi:hypothetical protein
VAGLTAALRAPVPLAREVALRALRGLAAPEAWDGVLALIRDADADIADEAARALAAYPRDEAVVAIESAAAQPGRRSVLVHLAASPQPLAHRRLLERIAADGPRADRLLAYQTLGRRIEWAGATEKDVKTLLAFLRSDAAAGFKTHQLVDPLRATHSLDVARALVEMVGDPVMDAMRRHVAYWMLEEWTPRWDAVLTLVRANEAVFIARLDAREPRSQLVKVLVAIHSPAARAALERAAVENPDDYARKTARKALATW